MVIDLIRKLIGDEPTMYEDSFSVENKSIISFSHFPLNSATILIDGTPAQGTLNLEAGYFESTQPLNGTIYLNYSSVWFSDATISAMESYKNLTLTLLPLGNNTFVMPIPYYPVSINEVTGATITYNEDTNTFTCPIANPQIKGTFIDTYSTVGSLLLLKGSMPEQIKREFSSFTNWADYSQVAKGLQDQAMAWFKMSGVQ